MNPKATPEKVLPTILIVDDTPSNIGVIAENLEESGYRVLVAQDGAEGLQRADFVQPDLILLDVMMPEIDGFEVCRKLKKQASTRDIPVIFMTARTDTEDKVAGFNAGAVDYVTKPLQIGEVIARVETQLNLSAMQKRLETQNAQLRRYREQLEQRVAERTMELSDTNQRLRAEIQERKKAQEELAARERDFRTLAENMPDNILRYDSQCRAIYMNPMLASILGEQADAIVGKTPQEAFPDGQYDDYQACLAAVIQTGQPREIEITLRDDGAEPHYHHVRFVAERDAQGEIAGVLAIGRDITGRKRAERELLLLNRALDCSFDATYLLDADLRIRYVNEAAVRELGYGRDELLTMSLSDIDTNITRESVQELMRQTVAAGRFPGTVESRHRRKNGETFAIEVGATTFTYEGENLFLTVVRNITGRKYVEEALAAREREFRTLAENIPDNIIRYDRNARKIYVNTATAQLMGVKAEDLLNQTPEETPADMRAMDIDEFARRVRLVLDTGEPQEMEVILRHAEKGRQVHNVRFVAERNEQGDIVGALMVGRDITALKAVEDELKEREQRYHEIFDNAVEGMYLLEVTGDGRFRNLDINPALAESTGMPREAMIGKFVDDTVSEEVGRLIVEKYRRCVAAGKTLSEHIELDLPAGRRYYYSTITPIYYDGHIHRLIGISRDITELKRAERELEESRAQLRGLTARREEAREEERKYIAREVHDELGQILTGLQLNVSVLEHKFAPDLPPLREHLKETKALTDRALAVARNVASALRPAALDMGINSALEWLAGRFGANTGIQCKMHFDKDEVQLDENHAIALFRIVQESLTNVSRHAGASRVDVTFGKDAEAYYLKVRDNGKGFEVSAKKMDSFGLVGIRERALMLGGTVVIASSPGKGTEIDVHIPVNIKEVKA